jgi:hypothetical protein
MLHNALARAEINFDAHSENPLKRVEEALANDFSPLKRAWAMSLEIYFGADWQRSQRCEPLTPLIQVHPPPSFNPAAE